MTLIPPSCFPPITLKRPLQVMGKSFEVHSSCEMTFALDTLLRAVADSSLQSLIRNNGTQHYQHLKKLYYFADGKHQLSPTTKTLLIKDFGSCFSEAEWNHFFRREVQAFELKSDWDLFLQGMGEKAEAPFDFILRKMMLFDEQFLEILRNKNTVAGTLSEANFEQRWKPFLNAWRRLNPNLSMRSFFLIESSLQVLVEFEYMCAIDIKLGITQASRLGERLAKKRRPMGHWLKEVMDEAKCRNLLELSKVLHSKQSLYLDRPISHDLLKKWSSSKLVLMPSRALRSILKAVRHHDSWDRLEASFYLARFMTFLCDVVWATTMDPIVTWESAQDQIKSRYEELYQSHPTFDQRT